MYKKRLTKSAEGYTKSTPPHVKAIRMLEEAGLAHGRDVEYYMTPAGPVPVQLKPDELDYNHYLDKQIRPLADGVLFALDLTFDGIIEGGAAGSVRVGSFTGDSSVGFLANYELQQQQDEESGSSEFSEYSLINSSISSEQP